MWHLLLILLACLLFASGDIGFFIGVLLIVVFLCAVTDSWWILPVVVLVLVIIAVGIYAYDKHLKRVAYKKRCKALNLSKISDKNIDTLVKLVGRLPCDGRHYISQSNVADIVTPEQWDFCVKWFRTNAVGLVVVRYSTIRAKYAAEKTELKKILCDEKEKRQHSKTNPTEQ